MKIQKKKNIKTKKRNLTRRNSWLQLFVLLGIVLMLTLFLVKPYFLDKSQEQLSSRTEDEFRKEGQLTFFDKQNKNSITTIEIEIADNDYEIALGLMYRYSMSNRVGMLFIMEEEKQHFFWMKDTYISLDIIYLNEAFEIVKIHKYTQPLSEQSIPSIEKSKYVIEVIGGFCDELNIEEGDSVGYERTSAYNES